MYKTYSSDELDSVVFEIKNNKAVITPTDTVMGILSRNKPLLYEIKQRPSSKQIITFINDPLIIKGLIYPELKLLYKFWPGALSIVKNGISYRIPNHNQILYILSNTGPLFCTSANLSGMPTINDYLQAPQMFDEKKWYDHLVCLEGKSNTSKPSTIYNFDKKSFEREGEKYDEIKAYLSLIHSHKFTLHILLDNNLYQFKNEIHNWCKQYNINHHFYLLNQDVIDELCPLVAERHPWDLMVVLTSNDWYWDCEINQKPFIRSALVYDYKISTLARLHDDANVMVLNPLNVSNPLLNYFKNFVFTDFEGGRHSKRVQTIIDYEMKNY